MKEVLIYGALVAAVVGASVPIIQNFNSTVSSQATNINSALSTQMTNLVSSISSGN